jgi:O-6-methylguanine DNA methyltransferase
VLGNLIKNSSEVNVDSSLETYKACLIDGKLGCMIAISDLEKIYLLEFVDRCRLDLQIERLKQQSQVSHIIWGNTDPIKLLTCELKEYFDGKIKTFKTIFTLFGTNFQKIAWGELQNIGYGCLKTYSQQAKALGKEKSYRAIANANAANKIAIIVPCHRVINSNGNFSGYAGGIKRKKWLIEHEKKIQETF